MKRILFSVLAVFAFGTFTPMIAMARDHHRWDRGDWRDHRGDGDWDHHSRSCWNGRCRDRWDHWDHHHDHHHGHGR